MSDKPAADLGDECPIRRIVAKSLQAVYRRRKYLSGANEGVPNALYRPDCEEAVRLPRHFIPTHVALCPRQRAKRLKTAGG